MKFFVIIATVVACTLAAPTVELQHPSPVNPNILVEVKPEERIIMITDPKEIAKFKRETKQPLYPTVLPQGSKHHITKRDYKSGPEIKSEVLQTPQILPIILPQPVIVVQERPIKNHNREEIPVSNKDNKETLETQDNVDDKKVTTAVNQKAQGLPAIFSPSNKDIQQKRDIAVSQIPKHHHPEESVIPRHTNGGESLKEGNGEDKKEVKEAQILATKQDFISKQGNVKSQAQPFLGKETQENDQQHKRDIPVPLVPKYYHPEESPKDNIEEETLKSKQEVNVPQTLPITIDRVTEETFKKTHTLPLILKERVEDSQHKRDIPVPLVPKYHHPEESPKESNEKQSQKDKKVVNPDHHHITTEEIKKPQALTLILKGTPEDTQQQHKRDIPVHLVPKHDHTEEAAKDNNEKEIQVDKKETNSENQNTFQRPVEHVEKTTNIKDVPAVHNHQPSRENNNESHEDYEIPSQNHHVPQIHHLPQTLAIRNHEHVITESDHKRQILPTHNNEHLQELSTLKDDEKSEHYVPTHLSQSLQEHIHKQEHHFHPVNLHKPNQQKPEIQVSPVQQNHKESLKQSAENKKEESEKIIGDQPNIHEVQVEDLSESKPHQKPIPHIHPDHKPNILDDHLNVHDVTTSTTQHPALRPRPVPVAELFSRFHN